MERALRASDHLAFDAFRSRYLEQLVAPMDDMWLAFAEMAQPHGLYRDGECVGSCALDDEQRLLRFCVAPDLQAEASDWLAYACGELQCTQLMVPTLDPGFMVPALKLAGEVQVHSLLYADGPDLAADGWPELQVAGPGDFADLVDFQVETLGAPRAFIESYVGARLERGELWRLVGDGGLHASGEVRRDAQQPGLAHLGMIVHPERRKSGLGRRLLAALVGISREQGLRPLCSTEVTNTGARRAIEAVGFEPLHRLLSLQVQA